MLLIYNTLIGLITLSMQIMGFPGGASGQDPSCQYRRCKRHRFDTWVGKIPWRRACQSTPLFFLENPMDRGDWQATVCWVAKSWT